MFNLGFGEIAVILVVALIFLGPKMLPEIATGLGKVIREIRKATADIRQDIELDDMIRKPLQELRDAATLPPEELKRRDAAKAALRKAQEEEAQRKREAAQAEETRRKQQEAEQRAEQRAEIEAQRKQQAALEQAQASAAALPKPSFSPSDVVSAGGTMIANPPPSKDLQTLTPLPELTTMAPVLASQPPPLPPPPPPAPPAALPPPRLSPSATRSVVQSDATVFDLQAQLNATAAAKSTHAARSGPPVVPPPSPLTRPLPPRRPEGKKG